METWLANTAGTCLNAQISSKEQWIISSFYFPGHYWMKPPTDFRFLSPNTSTESSLYRRKDHSRHKNARASVFSICRIWELLLDYCVKHKVPQELCWAPVSSCEWSEFKSCESTSSFVQSVVHFSSKELFCCAASQCLILPLEKVKGHCNNSSRLCAGRLLNGLNKMWF